jgi:hypothetical protein
VLDLIEDLAGKGDSGIADRRNGRQKIPLIAPFA